MTYRDDREADHARVQALEGELALAERKISELEGRRGQALALATPGRQPGPFLRWLGAPLTLVFQRDFDGAYPTDRFEELLAAIRTYRSDHGLAEVLKTSLTWYGTRGSSRSGVPATTINVTVADGKTRLTVTHRAHAVAGGIYGGVGGGVGGGAIVLPLFLSFMHPALAPVFVIGWFGGVLVLARSIFKPLKRRQAQLAQQLFEAVAAEIEKGLH